jgi:hypothetical protein
LINCFTKFKEDSTCNNQVRCSLKKILNQFEQGKMKLCDFLNVNVLESMKMGNNFKGIPTVNSKLLNLKTSSHQFFFLGGLSERILFFLALLLLQFLICRYFNHLIFNYDFLFASNFNILYFFWLILISLELKRKSFDYSWLFFER